MGDQRPQAVAHAVVLIAIVLAAVAVAVALVAEAEWSAASAAACAAGVMIAGALVHTIGSQRAPATAAPVAVRKGLRRTKTAVSSTPKVPIGSVFQPIETPLPEGALTPAAMAEKRAEPSELALAILAHITARSQTEGDADELQVTPGADAISPYGFGASDNPTERGQGWEQAIADHVMAVGSALEQQSRSDGFNVPPAVGFGITSTPRLETPSSVHVEETDFERVDRLVRRLADQVNEIDRRSVLEQALTIPRSQPVETTGVTSDHLARSIAALRIASNDGLSSLAGHLAAGTAELVSAQLPSVSDEVPADLAPPMIIATPFETERGPARVTSSLGTDTLSASILSAINAQRIDVYLEPIRDLAGDRAQHYEVSIGFRGPTGALIDLASIETDLSGTGMLPLIDQTRIARAADMARTLAARGKHGAVLAELNGETLDDPDFQESFAGANPAGAFPGQMVLALQQAHVRLFTPADWHTLTRLKAAGFVFALSDVTGLDMDFESLADAGFVFARLDAAVFLDGLPMADMMIAPADICRHLAGSGLALIVGNIADEGERARIFGSGVALGQGRLFGGPRAVKASAVHSAAVAAE